MAKPGLPKKYAKLGFKKGWAAYKKAKRDRMKGSATAKRSSTSQKKTVAKAKPKTKTKTVVKTVIKYKKTPAQKSKPKGKKMGKTKVTLISKKTIDTLIGSGMVGGGTVLSTLLVNKLPIIKNQKPLFIALTQGGVMFATLPLSKYKLYKQFVSGSGVGAAISMLIPLMPEGFRLGSSGRTFSETELAELQTVGRPVKLVRTENSVGRPVKISPFKNAMGHKVFSRGKRGYAAY